MNAEVKIVNDESSPYHDGSISVASSFVQE